MRIAEKMQHSQSRIVTAKQTQQRKTVVKMERRMLQSISRSANKKRSEKREDPFCCIIPHRHPESTQSDEICYANHSKRLIRYLWWSWRRRRRLVDARCCSLPRRRTAWLKGLGGRVRERQQVLHSVRKQKKFFLLLSNNVLGS